MYSHIHALAIPQMGLLKVCMKTSIAIQQVGDKKDRTYRVAQHSANCQPKLFTVKGVGKSFTLFDGEQQLQSFNTLTKCYEYIKGVTA